MNLNVTSSLKLVSNLIRNGLLIKKSNNKIRRLLADSITLIYDQFQIQLQNCLNYTFLHILCSILVSKNSYLYTILPCNEKIYKDSSNQKYLYMKIVILHLHHQVNLALRKMIIVLCLSRICTNFNANHTDSIQA